MLFRSHGLGNTKFTLSDRVLEKLIESYTRESGVRELDRQLASIMRNQAKEYAMKNKIASTLSVPALERVLGRARYTNDIYKTAIMPGVAVGLAWTYVGGDILFLETSLSDGKGELKLTGNLGNVMKESAITALSYLHAHAKKYGIDTELLQKKNVHIHVPEGAVPKDGPSAGITILTSLVSAFTGKKVKPWLAMTGEITLRGEVTAIGGLKEKLLAAHRGGIKTVLIPEANAKDLQDIPANVKNGLEIIPVRWIDKVLELALESKPVALPDEEVASASAVVASGVPVAALQESVKH